MSKKSRSQPARSEKPGPLRFAINAFLLFHIFFLICWCLPFNNGFLLSTRDLVSPYFIWSGLFQTWDMFSPSPKRVNNYLEAIVYYKGGDTQIYQFPRMEQLGFTDRYLKERYRKFSENLTNDANAALWPDAARFVARENNHPSKPVKMVFLVRYWSTIIPGKDGTFTQGPWDEDVFYRYNVEPGDLD